VNYDLKVENIILGEKNQLKLCDFGFADFTHTLQTNICGTPFYIAPELHEGPFKGEKVDIFALGVVFFCLHFATFPWNDTMKTERGHFWYYLKERKFLYRANPSTRKLYLEK